MKILQRSYMCLQFLKILKIISTTHARSMRAKCAIVLQSVMLITEIMIY